MEVQTKQLTEAWARKIFNNQLGIIRELHSEFDLSDELEYKKHANLIVNIGDILLSREKRRFDIDTRNAKLMRFLTLYFNDSAMCEEVFEGKEYKLHKNLLIIGSPGTGKTLAFQIFAQYLEELKNPNRFKNISITEIMNYYKLNGHIDKYTYNEKESKKFEGNPFNVVLNDIGLETENQKSYGTSLVSVIDEFLYARYEIYQNRGFKYHLTSNSTIEDFEKRFGDRLVDRFKMFNVIILDGESRRR